MEMMIHPAAWRCGYYLFSGSRFYKDTNSFILLKNTSNIPVDNGSSFNRIPVISVFAVRVTPIFTNNKHALNTLKMGSLLRSDVMLSLGISGYFELV
jgi:hypothetical protein